MSNSSNSAFELLHPGIQRQLWRMKWDELRSLQVRSINELINTTNNVIIGAATASGKTEAAFLPILSLIAESPDNSIKALYIGPLRALINDQFSRMEELCSYIHMPVHRWHSDVSSSKKKALIKNPSGILLLTPESLESILINHSIHVKSLFHALRFIVIDELHAFLGNERGLHLCSLLSRLNIAIAPQPPFRKIGLSATIGDYSLARKVIHPENPELVTVIEDKTSKDFGLKVHSYLHKADLTDLELVERRIANDLLNHCGKRTNLIFANARSDVEVFADACKEAAKEQINNAQQFVVHHGSLSRSIREDTEERLKSSRAVTAICSSTLELGIDIGNVRMVGQIGAPGSVASLKQRLGRSGRGEGESQILRIYLDIEEVNQDADIFKRLYLPLIQTISTVQLMLSHWVESAQENSCDLSTLTQQIMSVIVQTGGITASNLYNILCLHGAFNAIDIRLFTRLLKRLGEKQSKEDPDIIDQTPTGELILGLRGENLRRHPDFYAVFNTHLEFALFYDGRQLGSLPMASAPPNNEHLIFAGRRWQVIDSDTENRCIFLKPATGKKKPYFAGELTELSNEVVQGMRRVLQERDLYLYLDEESANILERARNWANEVHICSEHYIQINDSKTALMTWCGGKCLTTIWALMQHLGIESENKVIGLVCNAPKDRLRHVIDQAIHTPVDPITLAKYIPDKVRRKYECFLGDELLEIGISRDRIDIENARKVLMALQ